MSIPPERWLANLIDAAAFLADTERQEQRWTASDAYARDTPEEELNTLVDDYAFHGFIDTYASTISREQAEVITSFRDAIDRYARKRPGSSFLSTCYLIRAGTTSATRRRTAFEGKWSAASTEF